MPAVKCNTGVYTVRNPSKYLDVKPPTFRSSWELRMFQFLDNNPGVLKWSAEKIKIPYLKPTDKKVHIYIPDVYAEIQDKTGKITKYIFEIKPAAETGIKRGKNLAESITIAINQAKWISCKKYCDDRQIIFKVLTEKQLFGGNKK